MKIKCRCILQTVMNCSAHSCKQKGRWKPFFVDQVIWKDLWHTSPIFSCGAYWRKRTTRTTHKTDNLKDNIHQESEAIPADMLGRVFATLGHFIHMCTDARWGRGATTFSILCDQRHSFATTEVCTYSISSPLVYR